MALGVGIGRSPTSRALPVRRLALHPHAPCPASCSRRHVVARVWPFPSPPQAPPRPNEKFTGLDVKRIKALGPTMDDISLTVTRREEERVMVYEGPLEDYTITPNGCFGSIPWETSREPNWSKLPLKPRNLFMQGLRERNWTSPYYKPDSSKWQLQIWQDRKTYGPIAGFQGYRVVLTEEDGSKFWVDLPEGGSPTYLKDYLANGYDSALVRPKHAHIPSNTRYEDGYENMMEELFEAHEERLPAAARAAFDTSPKQPMGVPRKRLGMDENYEQNNPAFRMLEVDYRTTRPYPKLPFWPNWGQVIAIFWQVAWLSFVFVASIFGIFQTRKHRAPKDLNEAIEFAQSKSTARRDGATDVTLDDVAGLDNVKQQFDEIVSFLRDPSRFSRIGVRPPKGVLLDGPPGCGKTLIAKAIAGEADVGFYQMSGSEFVEGIVGVGAARIRDLFQRANSYETPILIFIDEIDALAMKRAKAGENANEEREQALNQLLTEIDGFQPTSGVVFMGATNRAALLDPAIMRAGRFDRRITIDYPDSDARLAILRVHARKHPLAADVDLPQLALDVPGLVGADLANLLNEGALGAVREGTDEVHQRHIIEATERVLHGEARPKFSRETPGATFYLRSLLTYEAGVALFSAAERRASGLIDDIERVSVIQRGGELTRTVYERQQDGAYLVLTKKQALAQLKLHLAGHAAEEVMGLESTTYSVPDMQKASDKADLIIRTYGMSDLGVTVFAPPRFVANAYREGKEDVADAFIQRWVATTSVVESYVPGAAAQTVFEKEREKLVREAFASVKATLQGLKPAISQLADELDAQDEVTGARVKEILAQYSPEAAAAP